MSDCEKECSFPDTGDVLLCPCRGTCERCNAVLQSDLTAARTRVAELAEERDRWKTAFGESYGAHQAALRDVASARVAYAVADQDRRALRERLGEAREVMRAWLYGSEMELRNRGRDWLYRNDDITPGATHSARLDASPQEEAVFPRGDLTLMCAHSRVTRFGNGTLAQPSCGCQAAPADGPTCANCGAPTKLHRIPEVDRNCARIASGSPAPAVLEPVREPVPYPATPAAEEKKT